MGKQFSPLFYKPISRMRLVQTATPTGMLRNPADIVNHPRPWLAVKAMEESQENQTQKKTLIFFDAFFQDRQGGRLDDDDYSRSFFSKKLNAAHDAGFQILIPLPTGQLRSWQAGEDISSQDFSYLRDLEKQKILEQIFKKYPNLTEDDIFFLDYFGINQLLNEKDKNNDVFNENYLDMSIAKKNPSSFMELLSIPHSEYSTAFLSDRVWPVRWSEKTRQLIAAKTSYAMGYSLSGEESLKWLVHANSLHNLELHECDIKDAFAQLIPGQWRTLQTASFHAVAFTKKTLSQFLDAAPQLENLELYRPGEIGGAFSRLKPNALSQLRKLEITHPIELTKEDIAHIFLAAPNIESLEIIKDNYEDAFSQLKPKSLCNLKSVDLSRCKVTPIDVKCLLRAASHLETIVLPTDLDCSKVFAELLPSEALQHLQEIKIEDQSLNIDFNEILRVAPNLTLINTKTKSVLMHPPSVNFINDISNAKEYTDHSKGNENTLTDVLLTMPRLETCIVAGDFNRPVSPGLVLKHSNLKNLTLSIRKNLDNRKLYDLTYTLNLFPELQSLTINHVGHDRSRIPPFSFPSLVKLTSLKLDFARNSYDATDLENVLLATRSITTLTISGNVIGLFSDRLKGALLKLTEIITTISPYTRPEVFTYQQVFKLFEMAPNLSESCKKSLLRNAESRERSEERALEMRLEWEKKFEQLYHAASSSSASSSQPVSAKTKRLDNDSYFDTRNINKEPLKYKNYFPGVQPSLYRLYTSSPNLFSMDPESGFPPHDFVKTDFYSAPLTENDIVKAGAKSISLYEGREIILPSLNANEKMLNVTVVDNAGRTIEGVTLEYSASTQFYRIVLPKQRNYTAHIQLAIPAKAPPLPAELAALVKNYNTYQETKVKPPTFANLQEVARFVDANKTGACRLRAIAGYAALKKKYGNNVRINYNEVHATVEVCVNNYWHNLNLGGYSSALEEIPQYIAPINDKKIIAPSNHTPATLITAKSKSEDKEEMPAINFDAEVNKLSQSVMVPDEEEKESFQSQTTQSHEPLNTNIYLVQADSQSHVYAWYKELATQIKSQDIFTAAYPEEINLSGSGIALSGEIKKSYTPFNRWLTQRTQGTLVVDVRNWKQDELKELSDLLNRRIENTDISNNIQIVLLDKTSRTQYPAFIQKVLSRRVITQATMPLLPHADPISASSSSSDTVEIDLFESPCWQRFLIGSWRLIPTKLAGEHMFDWQPGKLLSCLLQENPARQIIFKNPPLDDESFTAFLIKLSALKKINWADQEKVFETVPQFRYTKGYAWEKLSAQASLHAFTEENKAMPLVLSDGNLLAFIEESRSYFDTQTDFMAVTSGYIKACSDNGKKYIDVVCEPDLSESSLAEFLTTANAIGVHVRFFSVNPHQLPLHSPLKRLSLQCEDISTKHVFKHISWQVTDDVEAELQQQLNQHKNDPTFSCFDLSYLESNELNRVVKSTQDIQNHLINTGRLKIQAPLAAIAKKLQAGETVLLSGKVKPSLYAELTMLIMGEIEGIKYPGKLILLTPKDDAQLGASLVGDVQTLPTRDLYEKVALLKSRYPRLESKISDLEKRSIFDAKNSFEDYERQFLQAQIQTQPMPGPAASDEIRSRGFDNMRLQNVKQILSFNPWVMILGKTGVGKTHFLHEVLQKSETFFSIEKWLTQIPNSNKDVILVIDEANFNTELTGEGENFLNRFKNLKGIPPKFLWKGQEYTLSPQHKVVFALNPANYGGGRVDKGFLKDCAMETNFTKLPDYYLRERIIKPLVGNTPYLTKLSQPIIELYNWFLLHPVNDEMLLTAREIKLIVNITLNKIETDNMSDPNIIARKASEIAAEIGKQVLSDHPPLLRVFNKDFSYPSFFSREPIHANSRHTQRVAHNSAYAAIQHCWQAKKRLQGGDIGLGGVLLENSPETNGKFFLDQVKKDYERFMGKKVYVISPTTPYPEKVAILREAFKAKGLVIAENFDSSRWWPNKLLNHFLMGLNEEGKEEKNGGFFFIATTSKGYVADDPALRRRLLKVELSSPSQQYNNLVHRFGTFKPDIDCTKPVIHAECRAWIEELSAKEKKDPLVILIDKYLQDKQMNAVMNVNDLMEFIFNPKKSKLSEEQASYFVSDEFLKSQKPGADILQELLSRNRVDNIDLSERPSQ